MLSIKQSISPIKILFIVSIVVLAALSVFSYKKNQELIENSFWVNHTNLVKLELENVLSDMKDSETGTRGFVLTKDSVFLDPYKIALKQMPASFKILDSLVTDNPRQEKSLAKMKALTANRAVYMAAVIDSSKRGPISHETLLEGKAQMDEIRMLAALMTHEEDRLLRLRTEELNSSVSFAPGINIVLAGFAVLLLAFSYLKILKELNTSNSLQKKLILSNDILEKSNAELAQFAFVASHDLQEPLRKIQTFISRIEETEKGLSERGRDYFVRIDTSAKRMQQLILDILSYSRINNQEKKPQRTDLNEVLEAAKEQLEEFIKEKNAIVNAADLPSVIVVRYQMEQLFANLLSNALKFAKKDTVPVITITTHVTKGDNIDHPAAQAGKIYHCIKVADNGIGFEAQYGERIFKIFQRLNTKEAYGGNGIGLSIVKKIMEAHSGFITAGGDTGKGAVFSLFLPV